MLTLSGPIFTYGLYYFDIFSDFFFMITLFMNCHYYYGLTSLSIICLSYTTTAIFVKFKFNIEFQKSLCYPLKQKSLRNQRLYDPDLSGGPKAKSRIYEVQKSISSSIQVFMKCKKLFQTV